MTRMILKPAPGLIVLDPQTGLALREEGSSVVLDGYWRRRLSSGDVVEVGPSQETGIPAPVQKPIKGK
jgi:hypothetical protein